jgi:hypothetical protein
MTNFLEQINSSFYVKYSEANSVIDLLRKLQDLMLDSAFDLNQLQKTFVKVPVLVLARNLGWLSKKPILLKGDLLAATHQGLVLKRGLKQELYEYGFCFNDKTKKDTTSSKHDYSSFEFAKYLELELRRKNMKKFMAITDEKIARSTIVSKFLDDKLNLLNYTIDSSSTNDVSL